LDPLFFQEGEQRAVGMGLILKGKDVIQEYIARIRHIADECYGGEEWQICQFHCAVIIMTGLARVEISGRMAFQAIVHQVRLFGQCLRWVGCQHTPWNWALRPNGNSRAQNEQDQQCI